MLASASSFFSVARIRLVPACLVVSLLVACAAPMEKPLKGQSVPQQHDGNSMIQFGKSDFDRLADVQMRENSESLRLLMIKLYKRNPRELKKSTADPLDKMVDWVFEGNHGWNINRINGVREVEALNLAFTPDYAGDRVLPFIVGLQTMLIKAHGGKNEFYMTDSIDPQSVYNVARNVEIAAWRLATARDISGQPYLLSNEISEAGRNLSFEREFGKIVGRLDLFAMALAEKNQRLVSRVAQNLATSIFLPF